MSLHNENDFTCMNSYRSKRNFQNPYLIHTTGLLVSPQLWNPVWSVDRIDVNNFKVSCWTFGRPSKIALFVMTLVKFRYPVEWQDWNAKGTQSRFVFIHDLLNILLIKVRQVFYEGYCQYEWHQYHCLLMNGYLCHHSKYQQLEIKT